MNGANAELLDPSRRVVVTGVGVVSPNGIGCDAFTQSLLAGRSGVTRYRTSDDPLAQTLRTRFVAACEDFDPRLHMPDQELRRVPRMIPMALAASKEALAMAKLQVDPQDVELQRKIAVLLGTGGGGLAYVESQYQRWFNEGKASLFSITAGTHGNLSSELSIALHLRGLSHVISTGCTSSTDAIGHAMLMVQSGTTPIALVGGADSPIAPGILAAFERMGVVSTKVYEQPARASRPFDQHRDGFVLGEGAWMFVIESLESAQSRGADVIAELVGYASTCDAFHRVAIAPDCVEPARAIELALAQARVRPEQIGYVNLHGTGTDMNDRLETLAVKKALGDHARTIPMSSTKSMIGHPQGACGAAGVAAAILCARIGKVHPTINLSHADSACDLDYVAHTTRDASINYLLCNCIAFGSKNSALVVKV
jgi:3-oxoacyl-[acyl-carrier-protein] synthase II